MTVLDKIIAYKKEEVAARKKTDPVQKLVDTAGYHRRAYSLRDALTKQGGTGIIAEFKRQSPSKGVIHPNADVEAVTEAYYREGAAAISVLTDTPSFGGSIADLQAARRWPVPILRKDFIIDPYQIVEAKSMGADVVLLIAACLTPREVVDLTGAATSNGLEVLLELHSEEELGHIIGATSIIGINNRDLKTFEVDIDRSLRMAKALPPGKIKIAESGINSVETITLFKAAGFQGFLVGENFMKAANPAIAFASFVKQLNSKA